MKFNLFKIVLLLLFSTGTFGQSSWIKISEREINKSELRVRTTMPSTYQLFSLDLNLMKQQLENAPLDSLSLMSPNVISFPDGEGKITAFSVREAPIMEAGLQVKYPSLKSYIATGIENPRTSLRISVTDFGLHAMSVTNEKGTYFIDSYSKDSSKYLLYYKKHCTSSNEFICHSKVENIPIKATKNTTEKLLSSDGYFRQYRMAMTAASDYSQFHIDEAGVTDGTLTEQKSAVLSALLVTMTRINGIFERDLGIRMNLVANNDLIILIGPESFQFSAGNHLNENIQLTDNIIGHTNYDLGHVVMTIGYNMGVPALCHFDKAAGTTGSYTPVGDPFDIDYVGHEVGHQFGAGHTFYSDCGNTADDAVSVEPGSGSTIMSYAGICDPSVQNHADAYFTTASILQIQAFINAPEQNCGAATTSSNVTPIIAPLNNYTIPLGTAFVLKGNATATYPSLLTYCWEQIDVDSPYEDPQPQPPLNTNILGPNFRSFFPNYSPDRYMPNIRSVLQGNLYPKWETTSNVARTMNFALTVRDNNPNGGQTQTATTEITVAGVGPFKINSLSQTNTPYPSGIAHNLTWDVAGTTENGIDTETVTVMISTDNGVTFTPLVSNTLNDGNEWIEFPNVESPYCRIMIKADGNIYYAMSASFSLGYVVTTTCTTHTDGLSIPITSDNSGVLYSTKTINIPTSGIINNVKLNTLIDHDFYGDFKIDLSSPENPNDFVMIYYGDCWDTSGIMNLSFSDDGAALDCVSSSVLQNALPHESLSIFDGQNQQGNWTLRVYDHSEPDEGVVTNWGLEICSEVATKFCAPVVSATGTTKTWNGTSWSPSAPTEIDPAVITSGTTTNLASFVCNSLDIGANNISITGTRTYEVVNDITGTGTISIATAASILQRNNNSIIQPTVKLDKRTRTNMYPLDYIYWGSPLVETPLSMLDQAVSVSGGGTAGAFDLKFKYVSGNETSSGGWQPLDAISPGKGFIMRIKQATPFSTLSSPVNIRIKQIFQGIANNGIISVPVAVTTDPTSARNNNLLANPYPSAIDADKFLAYNTNLDGVVYMWKAQTPNLGTGYNYSTADYIAYTRAGATSESGISTELFNGKIASGQGFKVKALAAGDVVFNNCMRVSGNNGGFMRATLSSTVTNSSIDRYKLNLIGNNGVGNQILVAYMPETTLNYDRMYDAELNSVSSAQLYSILDNNTKKLAINARPNFEITDVVNLGISKTGTALENFSIAIAEKEGLFATNGVTIFLFDTLLNQYHDFANGAYSFSSNTDELNNRFQLVYQNGTLSNPIVAFNNIMASIANEILKIVSNLPMTNIAIYDISGRLVTQIKVENKLDVITPFYFEEGIYIAKIKLENDTISTQKLINKK